MISTSRLRIFCLVAIFIYLFKFRGTHATEVEAEFVPSLGFGYVIDCFYQGNRFIYCSDPVRVPSEFTSSQNLATFFPGKPVSFRPIQLTSPQFPNQNVSPVRPPYPTTIQNGTDPVSSYGGSYGSGVSGVFFDEPSGTAPNSPQKPQDVGVVPPNLIRSALG